MVASGPFALGPAASGSSSSFRRPNNSFSSVGLGGPTPSTSSSLSHTAAPTIHSKQLDKTYASEEDLNVSEDEQGNFKVNMDRVAALDWSAPVALQTRDHKKPKPLKVREPSDRQSKGRTLLRFPRVV